MRILSSDPGIRDIEDENFLATNPVNPSDHMAAAFSKMSSGHKVVLLTITRLVEFVS